MRGIILSATEKSKKARLIIFSVDKLNVLLVSIF